MKEASHARRLECLHDRGSGVEAESGLGPSSAGLELWDAWVSAEVECDIALEAWYSAPPDEKECAYAAYRAALDREAQAAAFLARRVPAERRVPQDNSRASAGFTGRGSS